MGLFDSITEYFASNTSVAKATTVPSNALERSIENLSGKYKLGLTNEGNYIKFGNSDDFPIIIEKMLKQSPVHAGIISKKSKMVSGIGIEYNTDAFKSKPKQSEVSAFIKNCSGKHAGLHDVMTHAAFQYELHGAMALLVKWNAQHSKIVQLTSLDIKGVRAGEPNEQGKVTEYIVRRFFGIGADAVQHNEPRKIKSFDKFDKKNREQILYVKNPYSGNDYYGIASYVSAYHYITADYEFGKHIENSAANGFTPKVLATFIGRNMSSEQQREEYLKFKESFTGSEGDNFVVSWVKKQEDAPKFTPLDVQNLDKTIDVLSRLNDAKILTAHNVTSPTLFGVMVSGKLGGTGNELVSAYQIFRATETLPNRQILLDSVNRILATVGYDKIDVKIKEEEINLESIKGANTTDITKA